MIPGIQSRLSSAPEAYTSVSDLSRRDGCVARFFFWFFFVVLYDAVTQSADISAT